MGLTNSSTGFSLRKKRASRRPSYGNIAVAGNPNVGKSTLFNSLTGMNQHTGNWSGKTVGSAEGRFRLGDKEYTAVDVPGTYSLFTHSAEEEVAKNIICSEETDAVVVVCDGTCLERNLVLALQILALGKPTVICINLLDEARRKGIKIDLLRLESELGARVVGAIAQKRKGLDELKIVLGELMEDKKVFVPKSIPTLSPEETVSLAESIFRRAVTQKNADIDRRDRILDRLFTGKKTAYPIMIALLLFVFWLTVVGANYPSRALSLALFSLGDLMSDGLFYINCPEMLRSFLIDGIYKTLAWIVSVMLPPMAIFFPLFTLLEDSGYLPRVAFNLDAPFCKCHSCGKQALTMCMGFGCNAAGVVGCRIIDSPRERLIAMLTNSLVPCNGRFPLLIALISAFFIGGATSLSASLAASVLLTLFILLSVIATLVASRLLSSTLLRGEASAFTLELPPYRTPQFGKVLVRSLFDRTLYVLGRAVISAIPAGALIWCMANLHIGGDSILNIASRVLDPIAAFIGLDGVILMAFILALPANEIVIPIIIMAYTAKGSLTDYSSLIELKELFVSNGWTATTAICTMLFSLFHWPCATTILTIKKESGSIKWTIAAILIPTAIGILLCATVNAISMLIG